MLIDPAGEDFKTIFAGMDLYAEFSGSQPSAEVIQAGLADPSINPVAIVDDNDRSYSDGGISLDGINHAKAVKDIKVGTARMLLKTALPAKDDGTFGFLASSTSALEKITQYESFADDLSPTEVFEVLGQVTKGKSPTQAIQGAAFAVGMSALSAMGPVGAAAAAILGFVVAIRNAFKSRKIAEAMAEEERIAEAYRHFPPLMEASAGKGVDDYTINTYILPRLQTGDWTPIFSPRFNGSQWVVARRNGGMALAPGETTEGEDPHGYPQKLFSTKIGAVGFLPGRNRITSILQINVPYDSSTVNLYLKSNSKFLNHANVRDVGDFLVNSTRLSSFAWAWATSKPKSPHLYKIDVAKLHSEWKKYSKTGIETLRAIKIDSPRVLDNLYLSAIPCAIGTWQCRFNNGSYQHVNGHTFPNDMWKPPPGDFHPNRDPKQGCVFRPHEVAIKLQQGYCLSTIYDVETRLILDQVKARQIYNLRHTLLCAYVRRSWAAFSDANGLTDLLDEMRMKLLEHPDRALVDIRDVPPGEKLPNGKDLRSELIKRGVGKPQFKLAISPGWIEKPDKPAPQVPGDTSPMPFDLAQMVIEPPQPPKLPPNPTPSQLKFWLGAGLVGATAWLWSRRSTRSI